MGTLLERLEGDYKTALKAREQRRVDTLRLIKAAIQRLAIDKRKDALDEQEILQILSQQAKQRRETIEAAKQGNRQDVLTAASAELEMINAYLPKPLSVDDLKRLVEEALASVGPNQGPIMKYVMGKATGTADGKLVSQLVNERLKQ
ncbi:MAG: GatB/YqeY domain-containing protein [Candidatus Omnitrophica bacterium]|nr:GatB/YqeY domain-containing protein [Candidatus Omnitrophota bacterium]